jgi:Protein of unknown function (DUF3568)
MRRIACRLILWSAACSSGCATTATSTPTAPTVDSQSVLEPTFSTGRAVQEFPVLAGAAANAVAEAMDDLKMTSVKRDHDGAVYKIDARSADDRSVTVTIRPHQKTARVCCRVGWLGDEPLSRALLERVGVRLGTLPPAAIPESPPSAAPTNSLFSRSVQADTEFLRDLSEAPFRDRVIP